LKIPEVKTVSYSFGLVLVGPHHSSSILNSDAKS
jgi:hypothetical protein